MADFARSATVNIPARGIEERSALYYADRLAAHEREHVRQIERAHDQGIAASPPVRAR